MHPVFANAEAAKAVPIRFVTAANFAEATNVLDEREHAFVRAAGFEPKPGKHLHRAGARTAISPACCSAWKSRRRPCATCSGPVHWSNAAAGGHLSLRQCAA